MNSLPSTLYKYFGPDRIDVLRGCSIRYSPFGALNDPFEGQPELVGLGTPEDIGSAIEQRLMHIRDAYEELPLEMRNLVPYSLYEQEFKKILNVNESEIVRSINELAPLVQKLMIQNFDNQLGVLCLSEVPDNLLMWAHYGASHTGFVLAFDTHHPYFNEKKSSDDEFRHIRRVVYSDDRPSSTLIELDGMDIFLTKSRHWSDEKEWRIFRPFSEAETVHNSSPFNIHLFRFPPEALRAVILGARSSQNTSSEIVDVLRANNSLAHVRLKRARLDGSDFRLRIPDEVD